MTELENFKQINSEQRATRREFFIGANIGFEEATNLALGKLDQIKIYVLNVIKDKELVEILAETINSLNEAKFIGKK